MYLARIILFITIWAFCSLIPDMLFVSESWADEQPNYKMPNRDEVIRVFREAIKLNEDFKNTVGKIPFERHLEKRRFIEKYDEEVLWPKLQDCVKLLSSGRDISLAVEFFKLLISYENSAAEELPNALGKAFINNPDLIVETFNRFGKTQQLFLYENLEFGFRNNSRGIPNLTINGRLKRLESLKSKIYSIKSETNVKQDGVK